MQPTMLVMFDLIVKPSFICWDVLLLAATMSWIVFPSESSVDDTSVGLAGFEPDGLSECVPSDK